MGKPGPKAHSVINDLLKKAKGKSPLKAMYGQPLKKVAFSIQKFLSISSDRHELASLVYPNFDSWTWSDKQKIEANKIWRDKI